ncbi:MAG: dockerin type I domain-containing protein [Phycisphaerales bacterium]
MNANKRRLIVLLSASGVAAGIGSFAGAGPKVVNLSGATLLENTLKARAATNDYIDVDKNNYAGKLGDFPPQQLATTPTSTTVVDGGGNFPADQYWGIHYRGVGSVRGIAELLAFGNAFVTTGDSDPAGLPISAASFEYYNRIKFQPYAGGGIQNTANPGGFPVRSDLVTLDANYSAPNTPSAGGIRIDIAPSDVFVEWAKQYTGGAGNPTKKPGQSGYGSNSRFSVNPSGISAGAGFFSNLPLLTGSVFYDPSNPPPTSATNVFFNNAIAFEPIAAIVNPGVGRQQATQTELRHLFATGRLPSGENLIAVTRDVESGTRNGFNNAFNLDPSYGVGENVGGVGITPSNAANEQILGAVFVPSNKGGSGQMETTTINARLAVGYVGPERGFNSWLTATPQKLELLAVQNDLQGGTVYNRPNIDAVLDNTINGWTLGTFAQLVTLGSPLAESVADGGTSAILPKMNNKYAASFINNMTQSVNAFVSVPANPNNDGMPGEFLATQLVLGAAPQNIQNKLNPLALDPNPNFSAAVQTYTRANSVLSASAYYSYNTSANGVVPTRTVAANTYSDKTLVPAGTSYINQGGTTVAYGLALTTRNRISGDFSGNGVRDLADIGEMIKAFNQRAGGAAWVPAAGSGPIAGAPGNDAIIEVLGDFNGDGNFDKKDIRYFADGLLLIGGNLDRGAAFTEVDAQGGGNFFATTLATAAGGATYTAGASRADVAGAAGSARGWAPVGADGTINAKDIDYVYAQFKLNPSTGGGAASWSNLQHAINADLSADMDGNLIINQADVDYVVQTALQTSYGDVNLDRKVNAADFNIWAANYNTGSASSPAGWAKGDVSGDGKVFDEDYHVLMAHRSCAADLNNDALVDDSDFVIFASAYNDLLCPALPGLCPADLNDDGQVDDSDFVIFAGAYNELLCP